MTVPRTRDIYIRHRRVPLAEVYCSVSENPPPPSCEPTKTELSVEVTPAYGAVEVGGFATLPAPVVFGAGWDLSEKAKAPDSRCAVWR